MLKTSAQIVHIHGEWNDKFVCYLHTLCKMTFLVQNKELVFVTQNCE